MATFSRNRMPVSKSKAEAAYVTLNMTSTITANALIAEWSQSERSACLPMLSAVGNPATAFFGDAKDASVADTNATSEAESTKDKNGNYIDEGRHHSRENNDDDTVWHHNNRDGRSVSPLAATVATPALEVVTLEILGIFAQ